MTDAELEALYERVIGKLDRDDPEHVQDTIADVRKCVEARSLERAIEILLHADWGNPLDCALKLRGAGQCPTCHGMGYVDGGARA